MMLAAVLLVGCTTTPMKEQDMRPAPAAMLFAFAEASEGTAPVVFKRDGGFKGSACTVYVFVDGTKAVGLDQARYATLHLPLGQHVFSATRGGGLCAGGNTVELVADVRPDSKVKYRVGMTRIGDIELAPTAF